MRTPTLFLLPLVGSLVLVACSRNSPEEVSQQYWRAVIADDGEAIAELVVADARPALSSVIEPGPDSYVTFGDSSKREDGARVDTTVHWIDDEERSTFETETVLRLEDQGWRVDPAATRQAFFDSVYRSTVTGLEAALMESAQAFQELGSDASETMARELSQMSRELQDQSKEASRELERFLQQLDEELRRELERHQAQ